MKSEDAVPLKTTAACVAVGVADDEELVSAIADDAELESVVTDSAVTVGTLVVPTEEMKDATDWVFESDSDPMSEAAVKTPDLVEVGAMVLASGSVAALVEVVICTTLVPVVSPMEFVW